MSDQLASTLTGETVSPVALQQSVSDFGLPDDDSLVGAFGRLQNPPPDEVPADKPDPEAQSVHSGSSREPTAVIALYLLPGAWPTAAEIPHHSRIGVKLDFVFEVIIGQRHECDAASVQHRLGHELIIACE